MPVTLVTDNLQMIPVRLKGGIPHRASSIVAAFADAPMIGFAVVLPELPARQPVEGAFRAEIMQERVIAMLIEGARAVKVSLATSTMSLAREA